MLPVLINGDLWRIHEVSPDNPLLVDRTGNMKIATTDPVTRTINIANNLKPPLLDAVVLHEVTHAITVSHGLLPYLRQNIPEDLWVLVEEWSAELVEKYGMKAMMLASQALGRELCIDGYCIISN